MQNLKAILIANAMLVGCASDPATSTKGQPSCASSTDLTDQYDSPPGVTAVGSVTLPVTLASGTLVGLEIQLDTPDNHYDLFQADMLPRATNVITYKWTNIPANATNVSFGLRADANANQSMQDSGDYVGYTGGTTASPIVDFGQAMVIPLAGNCTTGADFGVGTEP